MCLQRGGQGPRTDNIRDTKFGHNPILWHVREGKVKVSKAGILCAINQAIA